MTLLQTFVFLLIVFWVKALLSVRAWIADASSRWFVLRYMSFDEVPRPPPSQVFMTLLRAFGHLLIVLWAKNLHHVRAWIADASSRWCVLRYMSFDEVPRPPPSQVFMTLLRALGHLLIVLWAKNLHHVRAWIADASRRRYVLRYVYHLRPNSKR